MKNILVICPLARDRRELCQLKRPGYNYIFFEHQGRELDKLSPKIQSNFPDLPHYQEILDRIITQIKGNNIDGVLSTDDYPGTLMASLVRQHLGLPGPEIENLLNLQHKHQARLLQQEAVPEATPYFSLVRDVGEYEGSFPVFIKPVKSSFSRFAGVANNHTDLDFHVLYNKPPESYLCFLNELLYDFSGLHINPSDFLVEELLEGHQVSLEGFVSDDEIVVLGIVDSVMYPGTMSFMRFEYPSCLEESVQMRMTQIARKVIRHAGLKNTFFNIELMYNPHKDQISIIEINPRLASQFADLFEKVDGANAYSLLTEVVLGRHPEFRPRGGEFALAASCVLRIFQDALVRRIPTARELLLITKYFPGTQIEICCKQGKLLSEDLQDGQSYRYALVHLGAQTHEELVLKLSEIEKMLGFQLEIKA